jgi:hypothetical protein
VIPLDVALRVARKRTAAAGAELVLPDDLRRVVVVGLVAAAHALQGTTVLSGDVRERVTVTLPGVPGVASTLLGMIPIVGPALASLGLAAGRTAIYLSPAAMRDGVELLATVEHELGHVGSIARGGLAYCGSYLLAPEVRAGGEAPCYGAGMAVRVACGEALADVVRDALASLEGYGLDSAGRALATGIIASAALTIRATGDYGGIVAELRAELAAEGVTL